MIEVKFVGIDSWNRPVFKDNNGNYYGSTDKLFDFDSKEEDVLEMVAANDLTYFGRKFGCEPWGSEVEDLVIIRG